MGWKSGNFIHPHYSAVLYFYFIHHLLKFVVIGMIAEVGEEVAWAGSVIDQQYTASTGSIKLAANLSCTTSMPMKYGTPFAVSARISNSGATAFIGNFSARVFDTLNHYVGTIQNFYGQVINPGATAAFTFGPSVVTGMVPMDYYHIQVMYQGTGATTWSPVANSGSYINYTTADVMNDTGLLLISPINFSTPLPVNPGSPLTINVSLASYAGAASTDFNGTLRAVMVNVSTGVTYPVQSFVGQFIAAGSDSLYAFTNSSFFAPAGLYALIIQHQYDGAGSFHTAGSGLYQNPFLVTVSAPHTTLAPAAPLEPDVYVFPNPATDLITVLPRGQSLSEIHMYDIQGREVHPGILPRGSAAVNIDVAGISQGVYFIRMESEIGSFTRKIVITH